MTRLGYLPLSAVALACVWGGPASAQALEHVKVVTTFLGLWDTSQPAYCKDRGEFAKAGLDVEVTSTRGGSENVQAVIAGGADIGYSPGINAVFAAYLQGAKIKIIGNEFVGQNDTYFYVPADSPIKTIDDLKGKSIAFPRPGGATEAVVLGINAERNLGMKPVATGGLDATFTMTMTHQVDVGYSFPPSNLDAADKGQTRVLFAGDEVKSMKDVTGRVNIASVDFLTKRRATALKFMQVLDHCIDWAYANVPEAAKPYAAANKADAKVAERAVSFYTRKAVSFGPVVGLDKAVELAVSAKAIDKPLTAEQLKDLNDIIYTTKP